MRPTDVLIHRRILLEAVRNGAGNSAWDEFNLTDILPIAEACYVSPDMTAVALRAGQQLPRHYLQLDDLPGWHGYLLWDRQASLVAEFKDASVPIRGVIWAHSKVPVGRGTGRTRDGVEVHPLIEIPQTPMLIPTETAIWWANKKKPIEVTHVDGGPGVPIDDLADLLLATWILMGQTIARIDTAPAERHERKRSARAGLPDVVKIVHLRRFSDHPTEETGEVVPWSHRWLVGGHWRNQYHPSDQTHRLMWIDPYVKGPQHLPLVVKDEVKALVR